MMMKYSIKTIAILTVTALMLTGCAENRENNFNGNESNSSIIENSSASTNSEVEEPTTSTVESKPEEKPVESSTTSTVEKSTTSTTTSSTKPVEKPATSSTTTTTSKPVEKPVVKPTSSTTTSTITSKPVEKPAEKPVHTHKFTNATCEKPAACSCGATKGNALSHNYTSATCNKLATCTICGATKGTFANHNYKNGTCTVCGKNDPNYVAPHNCDKDGHVWEITYTTTEPKWCREMHNVIDFGLDLDLASKYLDVNAGEAYKIFKKTLKEMGIDGSSSSASIEVEVWGTETYEYKECKVCHNSVSSVNVCTITPMGEWQFVDGVNRRLQVPGCDFNTLFYDPYNIPQTVIDNIRIYRSL